MRAGHAWCCGRTHHLAGGQALGSQPDEGRNQQFAAGHKRSLNTPALNVPLHSIDRQLQDKSTFKQRLSSSDSRRAEAQACPRRGDWRRQRQPASQMSQRMETPSPAPVGGRTQRSIDEACRTPSAKPRAALSAAARLRPAVARPSAPRAPPRAPAPRAAPGGRPRSTSKR